jgi:hypothetical protein
VGTGFGVRVFPSVLGKLTLNAFRVKVFAAAGDIGNSGSGVQQPLLIQDYARADIAPECG